MPAAKQPKRQNNKTHILQRYGVITFFLFVLCGFIVAKLVQTSVVNAKKWNTRAEQELNKTSVIKPKRGSILASNGNILACNLTVYDIRMDLRHPKLSKLTSEQWLAIDSLADSLNVIFPRHKDLANKDTLEKYSWKTLLRKELSLPVNKRRGTVTLATRRPVEDFERLRKLPFLKDLKGEGRGFPLYTEEQTKRIYPFGDVARLSLGRVYENKKGEIRGYAGLEMALDSLLYGTPGVARSVPMNSGVGDWVETPAIDGYDVRTTIDIDIQDMVEEELLWLCDSVRSIDWATAIVMEVSTGEIKAISNVERDKETGQWVEAMNRAVQPIEPGSVVKTISMMIAFEDGLVKKVTDQVETTAFQRTTDKHPPNVKDMKSVIGWSSNTGISRVIFRGYEKNPSAYYDRLASIGLFDHMNSGIGGETPARAKRITSKDRFGNEVTRTAQLLDLARQAYGYNLEIPPLYTLAYYNAIANGGKMIRPHLVHSLILPDGRDSIVNPGYIREQVCSPETAKKMQECLLEPVWGKGTANAVRDDRVKIAGKTGTVMHYDYEELHSYDNSKRRYAFAGYFPADNPRYSCIVVAKAGNQATTAAKGPGNVLKRIALKLFAKGLLDDSAGPTQDTGNDSSAPILYGSTKSNTSTLVSGTGMKNARQVKSSHSKVTPGIVPDVTGLDVSSALSMMEKAGYYTSINGRGYVVSQSVEPGTRLKRGSRVTMRLSP